MTVSTASLCRLCPAWLSIFALLRSSTLQAISDQSPMALIAYEFVVTIATYIGPQLTQTTQHSMIGYTHSSCSLLVSPRFPSRSSIIVLLVPLPVSNLSFSAVPVSVPLSSHLPTFSSPVIFLIPHRLFYPRVFSSRALSIIYSRPLPSLIFSVLHFSFS